MTNLSKSAAPAPSLSDLMTRPSAFFEALGRLPATPARYLWLVVLTSLISGVSNTLLARHTLAATSNLLSGANGGPAISPLFNYGSSVFGVIFVSVLLWLALWGLGTLGAGKEGRAAEVYGATFLPTLIWATVLLPVAALFAPEVTVAAPNLAGLSGLEINKAIQSYLLQIQAASGSNLLSTLVTWLGYAVYLWQFALAFIGFRTLTGNPASAWRGVLFPLALLLVLLAASWLTTRAVTGLTGL